MGTIKKRKWDRRCEEVNEKLGMAVNADYVIIDNKLKADSDLRSAVFSHIKKGYISSKQSICGGCKMSRADRTCKDTNRKKNIQSLVQITNTTRPHCPVITLSCLKKHSILSSLKTLLQETRFWKTLGIFFKATLRPSRGSVTDLRETEHHR